MFFFKDYKKYIGVDSFSGHERFQSKNCIIYEMSIADFIDKHISALYLPETFAICSYMSISARIVKENFLNLFIYYPSHVEQQRITRNRITRNRT